MNEKKRTKAYLRLGISTIVLLFLISILTIGIGTNGTHFPLFSLAHLILLLTNIRQEILPLRQIG